jgi:ABC-type uncharacterized transport system permease subunit
VSQVTEFSRPDPDAGMPMPVVRRRRRIPGWLRGVIWAVIAIAVMSTASYATGVSALTSSNTASTALRLALPILLCALGGLWAERAGVVNIGLEGMMILGTWGAAWGSYYGGVWVGLLAAIAFGALGGLLHAVATVTFNVNHIVSGVAINLLGLGVAKYLANLIFEPISGNPRQSPPVPKFDTYSAAGLSRWLGSLEDQQRVGLSDVAGILRGLVTGVAPLTMIAVVLVPVSYWILWRTRFGLRLRSCGENPVAAESLGVNVYRYKYLGVLISGGFAGMGGADERPRLHRPRRDDLRQLAAGRPARRRGAVRLFRWPAARRRWRCGARALVRHRDPAGDHRDRAADSPSLARGGARSGRRRGAGRDLLDQ